MRIRPIITQLETATTADFFKAIEAASSINLVESISANCPSVYVHPVSENPQTSQLITGVHQDVEERFAVLIAAQNIQAASEPLEDARDEIKTALVGFQPSADHDYIEFVSGEVVDVDKGVIWWRDIYKTTTVIRG